MSFAPFVAAAIPTVLAVLLGAWLAVRVLSARSPARAEARIKRRESGR